MTPVHIKSDGTSVDLAVEGKDGVPVVLGGVQAVQIQLAPSAIPTAQLQLSALALDLRKVEGEFYAHLGTVNYRLVDEDKFYVVDRKSGGLDSSGFGNPHDEAWVRVAADANKALDKYLRQQVNGIPEHYGMPVDGVRLMVDTLVGRRNGEPGVYDFHLHMTAFRQYAQVMSAVTVEQERKEATGNPMDAGCRHTDRQMITEARRLGFELYPEYVPGMYLWLHCCLTLQKTICDKFGGLYPVSQSGDLLSKEERQFVNDPPPTYDYVDVGEKVGKLLEIIHRLAPDPNKEKTRAEQEGTTDDAPDAKPQDTLRGAQG